MKILHVICGLDHLTGGPAVALEGLAKAQQRAGLSVSIFATNWVGHSSDDAARRLGEVGVTVEQVGPCHKPFARNPLIKPRLRDLVPRADVVHIHGLWESVQHYAAQAARASGVPYVVSPHGMLDRWSMRTSRRVKRAYLAWRLRGHLERAAAIHHVTEWEKQQAAHLGLSTPRIVEPIGLNLAEFTELPPRGFLRTRNPELADRPIILFLGRVHPGKGVEHLIPAMRQMENTRAFLVIAGPDEGGFLPQMQQLAASLGIADRVIFTGMLRGSQRIAALVDCDVFSLPSEHENFSIATAEALACGKPVVLSDQVGLGSLVTKHRLGAVVPLNITRLAEELDRWLEASFQCANTGRQAIDFAMRCFNWANIAENWLQHYNHLHSISSKLSSVNAAPTARVRRP